MDIWRNIAVAGDASERRSTSVRKAATGPTTLRANSGVAHHVRMRDFSTNGCAFELDQRVALLVGSQVRLGLAGAGAIDAHVVRRDSDLVGCVFTRPLSADERAAAFTADTVAVWPFLTPTAMADRPEPAVRRWPGAVRVATLAIGIAASWAMVVGLIRLLAI